jgi:hypothetical protein
MRVIGLDCATDGSRIGVALGEYQAGNVRVSAVEICSRERTAVFVIAKWLAGAPEALVAIDAPLGWPVSLARALGDHKAGDALAATPNDMFRRETDRFVKRQIGKTPLDVGADRIARTAHAALGILGDLRKVTGAAVPLACWKPRFDWTESECVTPSTSRHGGGSAPFGKPFACSAAVGEPICLRESPCPRGT